MEKVLSTITDCYGEETPAVALIQEGGLLRLWELTCFSSNWHNLGNCRCVSHAPSEESPISTEEVIQRFGKEALDGFESPGAEQLVFDAFGIEITELETFLRVSYALGNNPLPVLRDKGAAVVFAEDPDLLYFPDEESGAVIFIVNSHGEISVRVIE